MFWELSKGVYGEVRRGNKGEREGKESLVKGIGGKRKGYVDYEGKVIMRGRDKEKIEENIWRDRRKNGNFFLFVSLFISFSLLQLEYQSPDLPDVILSSNKQ